YLSQSSLFSLTLVSTENLKPTSLQNVLGIVGQDTILPCTISSTESLENPQVQWGKITDGHTENIYTYMGQSGGESVQKYRGRTSVPGDGFATGNVSLTLKNVLPADEGIYSCTVISREWKGAEGTEGKGSEITACVLCSSWPDLTIAECVTLDADTAHPRLELFVDETGVRDSGVIRCVPNNEKRFDSHLIVLAKQGYTSGKHYWEVDAGKRKSWAVGIALESVTRKGPFTLSPQNGFWVIGLADGGHYWAYTDPRTRLNISGGLNVIGIFLDIPGKQVTFYDVCDGETVYIFSIASCSSQKGKFIPLFSTGPAVQNPDKGLHSLSGELIPGLGHLQSDKVFPDVQREAVVFQCLPWPRVLSLAPLGRASHRC
uniref:Uncharacterized protein n=1 Tax=Malurus cyaneus samueli TaxID=2593467 RepID=A0A8C5U4T0_9PASS